jgi:molybdopterin-guanine dinucleotide biosynthesis protein A
MGQEKAFLSFRGKTLWSFQLEKISSFAREVLVSARPDFPLQTSIPCSLVADEISGLGPLGGLSSVLVKARYDRVLLLAVDMPQMTPEFLRMITSEAGEDWGVVPEWEGYYQGLAAVYPKKILPLVHEVLAERDHSFQRLHHLAIEKGLMRVYKASAHEGMLFQNWNHPKDLAG